MPTWPYPSRVKAREAGSVTYEPERPCKYGHKLRYTKTGVCVGCRKDDDQKFIRKEARRLYDLANPEKLKERIKIYDKSPKGRVRKIYSNAKVRAKEKSVPFSIEKSDIIIPEFCPMLGIPLWHGDGKLTGNSPTLDRIVPSLGYIAGNVIIISHRANTIKNDATVKELRMIADWLDARLGDKKCQG